MTNELEPQRTSLDPVTIQADLSEWIIKVTGETNAIISEFDRPSGSGMSSETLLFDSTWGEAENEVHKKLVARLARLIKIYLYSLITTFLHKSR